MEGGILVNDTTNTLCTVPYLLKIKKYIINRVQKARLFLTLKKSHSQIVTYSHTYVSKIYHRFQNFVFVCTMYIRMYLSKFMILTTSIYLPMTKNNWDNKVPVRYIMVP